MKEPSRLALLADGSSGSPSLSPSRLCGRASEHLVVAVSEFDGLQLLDGCCRVGSVALRCRSVLVLGAPSLSGLAGQSGSHRGRRVRPSGIAAEPYLSP